MNENVNYVEHETCTGCGEERELYKGFCSEGCWRAYVSETFQD
tara:strand:- start:432 stop:560 length:129 start_codon:yes stop_codon:yes gene_type:complete